MIVGTGLVVVLIGLIASGVYLKWLYRPTRALAWADIRTLQSEVARGMFARKVHVWLRWLLTVTTPIYVILFAVASRSDAFVAVHRRLRWAVLGAIVFGLVGPPVAASNMKFRGPSLRRWYVLHEASAYVLLLALSIALVVRPRVRRTEATEP